jgi:hypothetical protein
MITQEVWMDRRALARQGYHAGQIDALVGFDRRTVKKHLQQLFSLPWRLLPRSVLSLSIMFLRRKIKTSAMTPTRSSVGLRRQLS